MDNWLNVIPSHALGLYLLDRKFILCLEYWLGLQIVEDGAWYSICQVIADSFYDHHVGCGGNGYHFDRHKFIRDTLFLQHNLLLSNPCMSFLY